MANTRLLVWMTLLVMIWLTYRQWLYDYPPAAPAASASQQADPADTLPPSLDTLPQVAPPPTETPPDSTAPEGAPARTVRVRTDVLELTIDLRGGDLVRADVPDYPVNKDQPDVPVRLLDYASESRWVYQSGLRSTAGGEEPNHLADFTSAATEFS